MAKDLNDIIDWQIKGPKIKVLNRYQKKLSKFNN